MSGDYSRKRFNPEKHYQGVLRQQGRVDLDADSNELVDLQDRRWRAWTIDVIGPCGVPSATPGGFQIAIAAGQLTVGQGRCYVDGRLAENHGDNLLFNATLEEKYGTKPLPVDDQPYGAGPVAIPKQVRALVYLDVWQREVTYLQEPQLIEPALLGNVDTTTRYQIAWQVKVLEKVASDVTCETPLTDIVDWPAANLPSAARLTTTTVAVTFEPDPCLVPPSGGYRGLENHLYRVEVHNVTENGPVQVKWSRENAHVASPIVAILTGGTGIEVLSLGRDEVLRFTAGNFVEITDDRREFAGLPGEMRKVTVVDDTNQTMTFSEPLLLDDFPEGPADAATHLRVFRWDQSGSVRKEDGSELIDLDLTTDGLIPLTAANPSFVLEDGIQVTLSILAGGTARIGDYWCFAARTADADIERLDQVPPLGIHHHFCKLAIIEADGSIADCRHLFPLVTELTSLFYLGGDGQETSPGLSLPQPLRVGVAKGQWQVADARVRFQVTAGAGQVQGTGASVDVVTGADGVASCTWTLDPLTPSQQVTATLLDSAGMSIHLPVRFNATFSQDARDPGIHVDEILLGDKTNLGNDAMIPVEQFATGIHVVCDADVERETVQSRPTCFVTLEMPFPLNDSDRQFWGEELIGYQPLILAATTDVAGSVISWTPTPEAGTWLQKQLFAKMTALKRGTKVLARLTLLGNFIWQAKKPEMWLDGDVFGIRIKSGVLEPTALRLPSGDSRRGGKLEMWFWLTQPEESNVTIVIEPKRATLGLNQEMRFTVKVEGAQDKSAELRVNKVVGGSSSVGTIQPTNEAPGEWIYAAPAKVPRVNPVTVTATSVADPTQVVTASVTLTEIIGGGPIGSGPAGIAPGGGTIRGRRPKKGPKTSPSSERPAVPGTTGEAEKSPKKGE